MTRELNFDIAGVDESTVTAFNRVRAAVTDGAVHPELEDAVVKVLASSEDLRRALTCPQSTFDSRVIQAGAQACSSRADQSAL
jgi:hypothetical protein